MNKVVVVSACRTPIGKTAGMLSSVDDLHLMSITFREALKRLGRSDINIDGVYVGCCFPNESYNLARKALIEAGLPYTVPGSTINRTCCSSLEALVQGIRQIIVGDANVVLVGGVENMSCSPHVMKNAIKSARTFLKGNLPPFSSIQGDLIDEVGLGVEVLAHKYGISRDEQDEYAYMSNKKAQVACGRGHFTDEIFRVKLDNDIVLDSDECIRQSINMDMFKNEKPVFLCDGTITKLNSSSINDGAAAMVIMSEKMAMEYELNPLAEYVTSDVVGTTPLNMGIAPAEIISKILCKEGLSLDDIGLIECNEAYAAQILSCEKILNWNKEIVNINGGSIALGHPLGCTGLRICITLIYSMLREHRDLGIAAMCAGGGMGQGILFKRFCR